MALIGDTIRLMSEFKTFNGEYVDPTEVTFTAYDERKNIITPTTLLSSSNKKSVGTYIFDYTIPDGKGNIICEFRGMVNDKPQTGRCIIPREFV